MTLEVDDLSISACITVNNVELQAYRKTVDFKAQSLSCFIPSQAGQNFAISMKQSQDRTTPTCIRVYVDGHLVCKKLNPSGSFAFSQKSDTSESFVFPDSDYLEDPTVEEHREIRVEYWSVQCHRDNQIAMLLRPKSKSKEAPKPDDVESLMKRAQTSLYHFNFKGEEVNCNCTSYAVVTQDVVRLVTFYFKYRSIDYLRNHGIIHVNPIQQNNASSSSSSSRPVNHRIVSPVPLPHANNAVETTGIRVRASEGVNEGSDDEIDARIKAIKNELATLERSRRRKRIKLEPVKQEFKEESRA